MLMKLFSCVKTMEKKAVFGFLIIALVIKLLPAVEIKLKEHKSVIDPHRFAHQKNEFSKLVKNLKNLKSLNASSLTHDSLEILDESGIEYCDGSIRFEFPRIDCKYGFQFGSRIPKCICFRGL